MYNFPFLLDFNNQIAHIFSKLNFSLSYRLTHRPLTIFNKAARQHISCLRPQNGHFIPARMDQFVPAGLKWAISLQPEWNGPFHSFWPK